MLKFDTIQPFKYEGFPTKKAVIYTLAYPSPNDIFYVGITAAPKERLACHKATHKVDLIFEEIETVDVKDNSFATISVMERYWVNQLNAWGFSLKNKTFGNSCISKYRNG